MSKKIKKQDVMFEVQDLGFNMQLEYGRRLCRECERIKVALHVISWRQNGAYPASPYATCMHCANNAIDKFTETIKAAKDEQSYILGSKL